MTSSSQFCLYISPTTHLLLRWCALYKSLRRISQNIRPASQLSTAQLHSCTCRPKMRPPGVGPGLFGSQPNVLPPTLRPLFVVIHCQYGRVVKAPDLKSGGLCPRRFESCCWRASIVQWLEFLPSKQVARVRFPVDALFFILSNFHRYLNCYWSSLITNPH